MAGKIGPLLKQALTRINTAAAGDHAMVMDALGAKYQMRGDGTHLPFIVKLANRPPKAGEDWKAFRDRAHARLADHASQMGHPSAIPLYLSHSLAYALPSHEIADLAGNKDVELVELDPTVLAISMNDACVDLGMPTYLKSVGGFTGKGVRVAVLDSGIDPKHPYLTVAENDSTCGEPADTPGQHGTHCAGSIASHDDVFRGIAPDVTLLNVKVLKANGTGTSTSVVQGLQRAVEMNADVISMSLGFNHLPSWSEGGHGWTCTATNKCVMCTAVDNAVALGHVVCVAAGNDHLRAQALRDQGESASFDTELGCPGQAKGAITVGALSKKTFQPAYFSSCGPTSYGAPKPDIACDGVNITSTVPVPRNTDGTLKANPTRNDLFFHLSGTSMATPMVAAACALIIEERRAKSQSTSSSDIRAALMAQAVTKLSFDANVVGAGRLDLAATLNSPVA